jgi:hypothetical protein
MRARLARFLAVSQVFLLIATLVLPALAAATEITTDLWVYQTGDTVNVTGIDFAADENVELVTTDPNGAEVDRGTAHSDPVGTIAYSFVLTSDVPGIYDVVATGVTSGLTAATQFDPLGGVVNTSTVEGSSGAANTHDVNVAVSMSGSGTTTLYWRTANLGTINGGAACGGTVDYVSINQTTGITKANSNFTIPVAICEDTTAEVNEQFTLQVADNSSFSNSGGNRAFTGTVTITNDDNSASVGDRSQAEGDSGTSAMTFTVTLNNPVPATGTIRVDYATSPVGGTSAGPNCSSNRDYISATGTLDFLAGQSVKTFSVSICGETAAEADETFVVNLTANTSTNTAVILGNAQAVGTIEDDDTAVANTPPGVSVTGVTDGSSYTKGSVPTADCSAVDAEDGNSTFPATLSTISGPDAAFGIGSRTASCSYTDGGGLTATASATYTITDGSAPSISYVVTPSAADGTNGWYKSNVSLIWTVAEGDSPSTLVKTGCANQSITSDQGATTYACSATSAGGNAGPVSVTIKRDATNPAVTVSPDRSADQAGWYNHAVVFDTTGTDSGSGVTDASCSANQTYTGPDGTGLTVSGSCTDAAGNVGSASSAAFDFDATNPAIAFVSRTPIANVFGWTNLNVLVTWSCADATSGPIDASVSNLETTEGSNQSSSETCYDVAGNSASDTQVGISIDQTDPAISFDGQTPAANGAGWNNAPVTLAWSCYDGLSGPVSATLQTTLSSEGADQQATATCYDKADNSDSDTQTDIDIDLTDPVIAFDSRTPANGNGWNNTDVIVTWTCTDALSGALSATVSATVSTEGLNQHAIGTCTDAAGNTSSDTVGGISIDKTAPVITDDGPTTSANSNGWYNADVTNSYTLDADISGPDAACMAAFPANAQSKTTTGEGFAVTVTSSSCTDLAGNTASGVPSAGFEIDKTAPVITGVASPGANANGWNNTDVSVSFTCADTGAVQSGLAANTLSGDNQVLTAETTGTTVTSAGQCVDNAGNSDTSASVGPIRIDKTAPVISSSAVNADASPYTAGTWTNQTVTVSFTCADVGLVQSTIQTNTVGADDRTLSAETSGTTVASDGDCVDQAGNSDSAETFGMVEIDKTAPVISGVASPGANANGWNKTAVSVTFTCADTGPVQSTIDIDSVAGDNQDLTSETSALGVTVTSDGQCIDKAGNSDPSASVGPIKIDLTDPSVAITSHASGFITVASALLLTGTASDTPSGIQSVSVNGGADGYSAGTWNTSVILVCGANTITATATDKAGRTSQTSISVTRVCAGALTYYQPIDQSTTAAIINTGKMGKVIPVKVTGFFNPGTGAVALTEANLAAYGLTLRIGVNSATCAGGTTTDLVEAYADAGASNDNTNMFRWSTSQWIYNLDTGKAPSVTMAVNGCYRLDVYLQDSHNVKALMSTGPTVGSNPYALFKPTK